jgi:hypothetical protein
MLAMWDVHAHSTFQYFVKAQMSMQSTLRAGMQATGFITADCGIVPRYERFVAERVLDLLLSSGLQFYDRLEERQYAIRLDMWSG